MANNNSKFSKRSFGGASGCYTCISCGKKTRETGEAVEPATIVRLYMEVS